MTRLIIRRKAAALCLSTGAAFLIALPAYGATTTANVGVGASVAANCTIGTAPVAFGAYDPVVANAAVALTATGLGPTIWGTTGANIFTPTTA